MTDTRDPSPPTWLDTYAVGVFTGVIVGFVLGAVAILLFLQLPGAA